MRYREGGSFLFYFTRPHFPFLSLLVEGKREGEKKKRRKESKEAEREGWKESKK
jgi:hypothetical protein